jgi:hypothetical protein
MGRFDELFGAGVAVSPPLDEQAFKAIPARRGVFLLAAADERPILLATAADIRGRLRFRLAGEDPALRRKVADLRAITTAVYWRLAYSAFETDWQYMELARAIWPDSYTRLLPRRPAWFISVDAAAECPCFTVAAAPAPAGESFGPFATRKSAEQFTDALADGFDLCRCVSVLRQAPRGTACPYKQMGRCAAPCDGSSSMEEYRGAVRGAVEFAGGRRQAQRDRLTEEMAAAAAGLEFERAAALKSRLERLKEFDAPRLAQVRDARDFRYVLVQPGPTSHQACTFLCDRGALAAGPVLSYPPELAAVRDVLETCDSLRLAHGDGLTAEDRLRMGLVAAYLFSDGARRGLILQRRHLTDAGLAEAIASAAQVLKLRPPRKRGARQGRPRDAEGDGANGGSGPATAEE